MNDINNITELQELKQQIKQAQDLVKHLLEFRDAQCEINRRNNEAFNIINETLKNVLHLIRGAK